MSDDERKRELKNLWKEKERQKLLSSLPISKKDVLDLFDYLDENASSCDHTLRHTLIFLESRQLDVDRVVAWLRDYGGYCDCEVIYNVEDKFGELLRA